MDAAKALNGMGKVLEDAKCQVFVLADFYSWVMPGILACGARRQFGDPYLRVGWR
jgi:hypothetical protein